ncbi:MAG: family 43 glycosylhydrolase [Bacteroidales bacterium]|nr:family 43 glycosylhydrolase [Bacteroidales bacterium]MCF8389353.1 family 43 glycosylhydrolase [Bacteroidales bacterium]
MKKIPILPFALILFAFTSFTQQEKSISEIQYPYKFKYEGNPLVSHISSTDPDVNVWDEVVWMYCSQDHPKQPGDKGVYDHMDGYHAFSSTDLIHWTDHGEVIHSRDLGWGIPGWMWAPAAAQRDGKYYLYYPHRGDSTKNWPIGVAVADNPAGPFKDTGKPIEGIIGMDPKVFIDDDGTAYLYCNRAQIAKLKPNMIEIAETPRKIDYAPQFVLDNPILRLGEGPYMHKYNGLYYYSYSMPKNPEHQAFYSVGKSPYGPFEWKGAFAPAVPNAQDHHSIVEIKGEWYYFYHINTPEDELKALGWDGSRRIACFERLYYNEDGTIKVIEHTSE